jgi:hypothetical protein
MKTEEIKKQEELNDEQLDNVAGAGILDDVINDVREQAKEWMEQVKGQ